VSPIVMQKQQGRQHLSLTALFAVSDDQMSAQA
jgi:hypothetical protein